MGLENAKDYLRKYGLEDKVIKCRWARKNM